MSEAVLDASAVLAVLNAERGSEQVQQWLGRAWLSSVNYAEVAATLIASGATRRDVKEAVLSLGIAIEPFDNALAERTGEMRPLTKHRGLSLGDRACLALAEHKGIPAITADRSWQDVLPNIDIRVVR